MKKIKILLSVFASLAFLSGCNMELNSTLGDETVAYSLQKIEAGTLNISSGVSIDGSVQSGAIDAV